MDVKTAFLNGDIEEELYMVQPTGFVDPKDADKVCKLQRSIYGLKQASRSWNQHFDKVIKNFGFIQNYKEVCTLLGNWPYTLFCGAPGHMRHRIRVGPTWAGR